MVPIRTGLLGVALAATFLLAGLMLASGLHLTAAAAGMACLAALSAAVAGWARASRRTTLTAADLVTLSRGAIACGVAALILDSAVAASTAAISASLAGVALALDAVDGWTARLSGTVSAFGARLDLEADAFLILVLSVACARTAGAWTLAFGAARYLFALAGWIWPWLGRDLPYRYWRKVVTGSCGVALACAVAVPGRATNAALGVALALLVESFGRDVAWLWLRRLRTAAPIPDPGEVPNAGAAQASAPEVTACVAAPNARLRA